MLPFKSMKSIVFMAGTQSSNQSTLSWTQGEWSAMHKVCEDIVHALMLCQMGLYEWYVFFFQFRMQ